MLVVTNFKVSVKIGMKFLILALVLLLKCEQNFQILYMIFSLLFLEQLQMKAFAHISLHSMTSAF